MKKTKFTVSIGIPSYNEEKNIGILLDSIKKQNETFFKIEEIIIYSDASTDNTHEEIRKRNDMKIKLLVNKKRRGQAFTQNRILEKCNSDALVLLNADILIKHRLFVHKLIFPIMQKKADLTSCKIQGIESDSLLGKILNFSVLLKTEIYESLNHGRNVFTCHGAARAMSRKLYHSLTFAESVGEDAYSYLYCQKKGFTYEYIKNAVVYIASPKNIADHMLQSIRFWYSKKNMEHFFPKDFVTKEYYLSVQKVFGAYVVYLFRNPVYSILFVLFVIIAKLKLLLSPIKMNQIWTLSKSTKNLNPAN